MQQLTTLNVVQQSLNRLSVNIETLGIENSMMKLGEQLQYVEKSKPTKKKRVKKAFEALSENEEVKTGLD